MESSGLSVLCEWRHKWDAFRTFWPRSSGPGCQHHFFTQVFSGNKALTCVLSLWLQMTLKTKFQNFYPTSVYLTIAFKPEMLEG